VKILSSTAFLVSSSSPQQVVTGAVVQEIHSPQPYDGLNITGVTGLTDAEIRMLKQLGAVEE